MPAGNGDTTRDGATLHRGAPHARRLGVSIRVHLDGRRSATAWKLSCLAATGLIVSGCGGGDSVEGDRRWIGFYPPLQKVQRGESRAEVQRILGAPRVKRVKKRLSDNGFGQGDNERHIQEGWIYSPVGWHGNIEVYFDPSGTVVGVNYGNG